MATFRSGQLDLHFEERGDGDSVVMLHGFGMNSDLSWRQTGWFDLLESKGFRPIALDSRGHGLSDKPADPADYASEAMTRDVVLLLDRLGLISAHFIAHSMGARTAFDLALKHPEKLRSLVAVGVGANLFELVKPEALIQAFRREDRVKLPSAVVQTVDTLLSIGNDKDAMIACLAAPRPVPQRQDLSSVKQPIMIVCGENDGIARNPEAIASALPRAMARVLPGYEHTDLLAAEELQSLALDFLQDGALKQGDGRR